MSDESPDTKAETNEAEQVATSACCTSQEATSSSLMASLDAEVNLEAIQQQYMEPKHEKHPIVVIDTKPSPTEEQNDEQEDSSSNNGWLIYAGSVSNLCSATLGAGVLSLPFALYQSGLVGGLFLLIVAAWSSIVSIQFLVEACDAYQVYTYESLVHFVLGSKCKRFVEIAVIVFCGGCAVAYVMAVGDILQQIATSVPRIASIGIVWGIAMVPLSLLRRMESLQWASSIGVASVITLVVAVLVHYGEDTHHHHHHHGEEPVFSVESLLWPTNGFISLVRAFPMVIFAFSCQVNVCAIYHELPSQAQEETELVYNSKKSRLMQHVTLSSVLGCAVLYSIISTFALLDFGTTVQPNILLNYCPRGIMHVAFGCMALAVVMAFPLNVFPARVAIESMMKKDITSIRIRSQEDGFALGEPLLADSEQGDGDKEDACNEQRTGHSIPLEGNAGDNIRPSRSSDFHMWRHVSLTLGIAGSALALALVVPDISFIFGLLGGTTSSALGFVIPGLLGRSLTQRRQWSQWKSVQSWILIVGGTFVGILTTGVTLWSTLIQSHQGTPRIPDACADDSIEPTASPTSVAAAMTALET